MQGTTTLNYPHGLCTDTVQSMRQSESWTGWWGTGRGDEHDPLCRHLPKHKIPSKLLIYSITRTELASVTNKTA